jgi:tetratricopeptide (TPR) repeat protein
MRRTGSRVSGALLGLALLTLSASVAAQPAEAGAAFERGVGFFRDGDYTAAMVEFKKAYELDPNWRVLYNLGQTSRELREYAAALTSFERYLSEGGENVDAERRKKVEGWIAELKGKVASVKLSANVEGAEVAVDDIVVGKTPLDKPLVVNAGRRKITVTKTGYGPLTRFVDVAGTEEKKLELELVALGAPAGGGGAGGGGGTTLTPGEQAEGPSPWPWAAFAITAAAGTATAVMGGLSLSKKADFEDELAKVPGSPQAIEDARDDARAFAIAADVLGGVTIAGAVVTIVGFAVEGSKGGGSTEQSRAPVRPVVGPGYVGLFGTF